MSAHSKLKDYLTSNGIKQNWFAEQIGVNNGTLSVWLNGHRLPQGPTRALIEIKTGGAVKAEDWE